MRETSWVSIRGAVFCRADASISSSPNLSRCPANARRERQLRLPRLASVSTPQALPQEGSDRRPHQFLPTLPSVWDRVEIAPTFQESNLAFVRKHRARGMS